MQSRNPTSERFADAALAAEDDGCAFVLDDLEPGPAARRFCDAPRRPGSAYCPTHHAHCHLASGSIAEQRQLREIEALAEAVGGRRGRDARQPPPGALRRLERAARALSWPICSRFVL